MKKYIMMIMAMLMATVAFSQTNSVYAKKLRARDEIQLGPNEVTQIELDTSLASQSNSALPTSYAVYWFVLNHIKDGVDTVFTVGNDFYLVAGPDTFTVEIPQTEFGSGTATMMAVWETDSTLTSKAWEVSDTYIRGLSTGWPSIEEGFYTFNGDSNTGIKRPSADVITIHTGDGSNAILTLDGPGEGFDVDVDDNGVPELSISAVKITASKVVRLAVTSSSTTTHLIGSEAGNDLTKVAFGDGFTILEGTIIDTLIYESGFEPSMATVHYNGQSLLAASTDTLVEYPNAMTSTVKYGDVAVDESNGTIITNFDGVADVTFSCNIYNSGSAYSSYINVKVLVNNLYVSELWTSVRVLANLERKCVSFQAYIDVSEGDEIIVKYDQGVIDSIYADRPTLSVMRVR